jgi:hypothetical protein
MCSTVAGIESRKDTVIGLSADYICRMSEKRKHEDDVDIYGDLPNFPCVRKVGIIRDLYVCHVQNFSCPCCAILFRIINKLNMLFLVFGFR